VLAATGPSVQIGYQGQWTDPATHQVNMGSRFYRAPDAGGFTTRDTKPASSSANMYAYADDNPMTVTDPSGHAPSGKGSSGPSASQVAAAGARATKSAAKAAAAQAAYDAARAAAAAAAAAAHSAAAVARQLNSAAAKLAAEAAKTSRQAAAAFAAARAQLRVAESWQDKANQAFGAAAQDVDKAIHEPWYEKYKSVGDLWDAGKETAEALIDEGHAALALAQYGVLEAKAIGLEALADTEHGLATAGKLAAKGAAAAARTLDAVADTAARDAQTMGTIASRDSAEAENDAAVFAKLSAEYARDLAHKVAKAAKDVGKKIAKVAKKVGKAVGKAAVAVGKAAYKASGAQAVVSCVTDPHLSSCAKAAITVAAVVVTTVATAGAGDLAIGAADAAAGAAEDAGADAAEDAGADAAEDAGTSCGGESFTAGTEVLLANGAPVPIGQLKLGDKVLATNTKTGKTTAETVAAVLVHHDTDLYDLTVRSRHRTAVIDTTSSHLFWDPSAHRWIKAGALKHGSYLRTSDGGTVTVVGGYAPRQHTGWMWDLTVPGNNDHDFYVVVTPTIAVLVHNCPPSESGPEQTAHGAERAADPSRLDPAAQADVIANPTQTLSQADGAQVFVQQAGERYNVVVQGERGVITNLKNISAKSFSRLARNYGWTPN
jgi:RHS repeat-associated protein